MTLTMRPTGRSGSGPAVPAGTWPRRPAGGPRGPAGRGDVTPERRGVLDAVSVELASCAPFGLLWWAREVEVPLPRPLHVAPRYGEPAPPT